MNHESQIPETIFGEAIKVPGAHAGPHLLFERVEDFADDAAGRSHLHKLRWRLD